MNTYRALAVSDNVIGTRIEDEVVLLNFNAGNYFGLRGVAVRIWELLEPGTSLDLICQTIIAEFDVPSEAIARRDIETTVDRLLQAGLIREC